MVRKKKGSGKRGITTILKGIQRKWQNTNSSTGLYEAVCGKYRNYTI